MEAFLGVYIKSPKEDNRKNRGDIAEKLGFLGRTVHNSNPRLWLKNLESFLDEDVELEGRDFHRGAGVDFERKIVHKNLFQ